MSNVTAVDELRDDIACLQCGYNLRGLRGALVTCPECGWQCDMAELVTRKWRLPWWQAPGFNRLAWPTAWLVLFGWLGLIAMGVIMAKGAAPGSRSAWAAMLVLVVLGGWGVLLVHVAQWWPGPRGVLLSFLTAVIVFTYLFAALGIIIALVAAWRWIQPGDLGVVLIVVATVALLGGATYAARRTERWIAQQCIRRYLAGVVEK